MGHGNGIGIFISFGNPSLTAPGQQGKNDGKTEDRPPHFSPKQNAAAFQSRQNQNHSAADLKNSLLSMLPENKLPVNGKTGDAPNQSFSDVSSGNSPNNSPNNSPGNSRNVANQTLDDVISFARDHENFTEFKDQPKEFWDRVKQMSDVQIVKKYANGHFEPRANSRYGELLEKFNRYGSQGFVFLNSLPEGEKQVFQARHLLDQQFGVDELFIGRGVIIDKSGNFAVRELLANNAKNFAAPLSTVLGLFNGKFSENSAAPLFAGEQFLLNAKTAALLGLSLTLYQNLNTKLPLTDAALPDVPPKFSEKAGENGGARFIENNLDGSKIAAERRADNFQIAAALISGALVANRDDKDFKNARFDRWKAGETILGNVFSAGATGAMFGAILGCVVPLAENNAATALSFASSVVIGTSERGLKYLSANLLISDVITSGVQNILTAAATAQLPGRENLRESLNRELDNYRTLAFLTS